MLLYSRFLVAYPLLGAAAIPVLQVGISGGYFPFTLAVSMASGFSLPRSLVSVHPDGPEVVAGLFSFEKL